MELGTHRNGGEAPLQAVADAWKKEVHNFHWSEYAPDEHAVELAKRLKTEQENVGPATPDPRNVH